MTELKVRFCTHRRCTEIYEATTGKFVCGRGPADCPCQLQIKQ